MLDFGFSEILLTSAIALVVLGPERLPKVARQVGNWMGRARAMARQLSEQLEREVDAEALLKDQTKPQPPAANRLAPPPYEAPQYVPPAAAPDSMSPYSAAPGIAPDPHMPPPDASHASQPRVADGVPGMPEPPLHGVLGGAPDQVPYGVPELHATAPDAYLPGPDGTSAAAPVTGQVPHLTALEPGASPPPRHVDTRNPPHE
jgi:Tat protein translocase TatB subunit